MTYCLAVTIDAGLVFASDSRTNAGVDQVATYSKMHTFNGPDRAFCVLSAGNLATTQAVVAQLRRDVDEGADSSLASVGHLSAAADYLGRVNRDHEVRHGEAVAAAGGSADVTFILGGQVEGEPPGIYLVYPQGNYISASPQTPFLQIGESKYGKAILDRIIDPGMRLNDAARCALVSLDSTMRSNVTVGPPIEVLGYERDRFEFDRYLCLAEDDEYLIELRRSWNEKITQAFDDLPRFTWDDAGRKVARG